MSLQEMRTKVLEELGHIPTWPKEHQSELRMSYWFWRMNSLGKKATARMNAADVLQKCIAELKQRHPDYEARYDKAFFRMPNKRKPG